MNMNERDIVSMTRDVWEDRTRYVKAREDEIKALSEHLKLLIEGAKDEE